MTAIGVVRVGACGSVLWVCACVLGARDPCGGWSLKAPTTDRLTLFASKEIFAWRPFKFMNYASRNNCRQCKGSRKVRFSKICIAYDCNTSFTPTGRYVVPCNDVTVIV